MLHLCQTQKKSKRLDYIFHVLEIVINLKSESDIIYLYKTLLLYEQFFPSWQSMEQPKMKNKNFQRDSFPFCLTQHLRKSHFKFLSAHRLGTSTFQHLNVKILFILGGSKMYTRDPETNIKSPKMDGWNTIVSFPIWGFSRPIFRCDVMLVSGRVYLLGQWLNFKLFGITYLVGKMSSRGQTAEHFRVQDG